MTLCNRAQGLEGGLYIGGPQPHTLGQWGQEHRVWATWKSHCQPSPGTGICLSSTSVVQAAGIYRQLGQEGTRDTAPVKKWETRCSPGKP